MRIIGWRKNGSPIYLMQGAEDGGGNAGAAGGTAGGAAGASGSATGGSGDQGGAGAGGTTGSTTAAGSADGGAGGAGGQQQQTAPPVTHSLTIDPLAVQQLRALGWTPPGTQQPAGSSRNHSFTGDGGSDLPDLDYQSALREVANLRKENGRDRTQAQNQIHNLYAQAIGVEDATPDKVVARLAALADADTRASNAALRLAVYQRASMIGANADRLLDSTAFLSGLAGLDPTGTDALDAKIREAADRDPVLRSQTYQAKPPPAGQAVTTPFGGTTGQPAGKPKSLSSALDALYAN